MKEEAWLGTHRVAEQTFDGSYTVLCFKWVTSKDLLYSAGNSAQCDVSAWTGGELGENRCMYAGG